MATDEEIYLFEQGQFNETDQYEEMYDREIQALEGMDVETDEISSYKQINVPATGTIESDHANSHTSKAGIQKVQSLKTIEDQLSGVLERCARLLGEKPTVPESTSIEIKEPQTHRSDIRTEKNDTQKYVSSHPFLRGNSVPICLANGEKRFLRKKTSAFTAVSATSAIHSDSLSVAEMIKSIEQKKILALMEKESEVAIPAAPIEHEHLLWVDKYKPNRFIDLLSDEKVNREVLFWVKQWDEVVFKAKRRSNAQHSSSLKYWTQIDENASTKSRKAANLFGLKKPEENSDRRPQHKIVMIAGSPGTGKTTLAHVIALHAGYNPIEINASDDRTASALHTKIVNAMEMQSISGDQRPNCIILDEIDGALNGSDGKSAIADILRMATAMYPEVRSKKKVVKSRTHPLTRPIICICNDQFAPVLRPLRKLAKIFALNPPSQQRLLSRLKYICQAENLLIGSGELIALCQRTQNDIRYCLNTLQLFKKGQALVKTSSDYCLSKFVGSKEIEHGIYTTMQVILSAPSSLQKYRSYSRIDSKNPQKEINTCRIVYEAACAFGNSSILLNTLDENLPHMIFNDPTMQKISKAYEWIGTTDLMDTKVHTEQRFQLIPYLSFSAVAVHSVCANLIHRKIQFPHAAFEMQQNREKVHNILQGLTEDNLKVQRWMWLGIDVCVMDILPCLLLILSPNIKLKAPSIQAAADNVDVQRLVEIMTHLGLSYRSASTSIDHTNDLILEPALHELCNFKEEGFDQEIRGGQLPLTIKTIIQREIELESLRKRKDRIHCQMMDSPPRSPDGLSEPSKNSVMVENLLNRSDETNRALRRKNINPFAYAHHEALKKRKLNSEMLRDSSSNQKSTMPKVRFKYNQGYTSGIRTTIYMRDLI